MAADARAPARPARPAPARRALARAKVNYTLHVTGLAPDGRHLLDSLVVFPEIGDGLTLEPASTLSLALDGPFADQLGAGADNLALRAAEAALRPGAGAALLLEKILPVASGIGGGSADAAAALRLAAETGLARASGADLARIGLALGADVPVCLAGRPAMMRGIGELLSPAPAFPAHHIVLANPLCGVSTGAVFAALTAKENPAQAPAPARFARFADFIGWLAAQRNDLEAPARAILPAIGDGLAALTRAGAGLARMSGSGATVFGLFPAAGEALAAAERLRAELPGWWIADAPVRVWEGGVHGV